MDYREASDYLYRCDSFGRLPKLLELHHQMQPDEWLRVVGEQWSGCDNIGTHRLALRRLLPASGPVPEMMTDEEQAAYFALPDRLTVFRGCGEINMLGACWSLDREVAARFPTLNRYRQAAPLLVTATVRRDRVLALKLDRDEAEIITFQARRTAIEPLS
jgi:hypothetical protein